jgi:hypothetical protein
MILPEMIVRSGTKINNAVVHRWKLALSHPAADDGRSRGWKRLWWISMLDLGIGHFASGSGVRRRRIGAGGRRQEAGGRRQEAGGRRLEAGGW